MLALTFSSSREKRVLWEGKMETESKKKCISRTKKKDGYTVALPCSRINRHHMETISAPAMKERRGPLKAAWRDGLDPISLKQALTHWSEGSLTGKEPLQSSIATIKISPSARSARGQRLNGGRRGGGTWGQTWNTKGRLKCVASNEHYQSSAFAAVAWSLNITSHWTESGALVQYVSLKGPFTQKWTSCHHLLTFMLF